LVAAQEEYLSAVEAGLQNPANVLKFPLGVRAAALRTVTALELRAEHPTTAATAAEYLAKVAATSAETFAAARAFAGCAAAPGITSATVKDQYAAEAVKHLKTAVAAGWRDTDALSAPEWDTVRKRAPEFAKVQAEVEKLRDGGK
jgi:hypothetical protein